MVFNSTGSSPAALGRKSNYSSPTLKCKSLNYVIFVFVLKNISLKQPFLPYLISTNAVPTSEQGVLWALQIFTLFFSFSFLLHVLLSLSVSLFHFHLPTSEPKSFFQHQVKTNIFYKGTWMVASYFESFSALGGDFFFFFSHFVKFSLKNIF